MPPPPQTTKQGAQSDVCAERCYRKVFRAESGKTREEDRAAAAWPVRDEMCCSGALGFRRELRALRQLSDQVQQLEQTKEASPVRRAPRVLDWSEREGWLLLDDCGDPLDDPELDPELACPRDWRKQMLEILETLRDADMYHNDVHPGNVCVDASGTLRLIDFGWATTGAPSFPEANPTWEDVWESSDLADFFDRILERAEVLYATRLGDKRAKCVQEMRARYAKVFDARRQRQSQQRPESEEPAPKESVVC